VRVRGTRRHSPGQRLRAVWEREHGRHDEPFSHRAPQPLEDAAIVVEAPLLAGQCVEDAIDHRDARVACASLTAEARLDED
jgi:hypothetical protein